MDEIISIITLNFNKSDFITDTTLSVLNQSYTNCELLIIDDYSTDNSRNNKNFEKRSKNKIVDELLG
jgi:glycosyltransferase involved in cell wall biosynthesis